MSADETNDRPPLDEPAGGLGGTDHPELGTRDARLVARALREHWPISGERRKAAIDKVMEALENSRKPRDIARLFTALISADRANIAAEKKDETLGSTEGTTLTPDADVTAMDATIPKEQTDE